MCWCLQYFTFFCILDLKDEFCVGQETNLLGPDATEADRLKKSWEKRAILPTGTVFRNPKHCLVTYQHGKQPHQPKHTILLDLAAVSFPLWLYENRVSNFKSVSANESCFRWCINCVNQGLLLSEGMLEICVFQLRGGYEPGAVP